MSKETFHSLTDQNAEPAFHALVHRVTTNGDEGSGVKGHTTIKYDAKDGIGAVPWNQEIEYRGFVKHMTPQQYLDYALPLVPTKETAGRVAKMVQSIKEGAGVGQPFLETNWDDKNKVWRVTGHEGRHRALAIDAINQAEQMPVHIFPTDGLRARDITDEMKAAPFVPEGKTLKDKITTNAQDTDQVAIVVLIQDDGKGNQQTLLQLDRDFPNWKLIGGHIQEGETALEGAVREVWEESGIGSTTCDAIRDPKAIQVLRPLPINSVVKENSKTIHLFVLRVPVGLQGRTESNEGGVRWFALDQVPQLPWDQNEMVDTAVQFLKEHEAEELNGRLVKDELFANACNQFHHDIGCEHCYNSITHDALPQEHRQALYHLRVATGQDRGGMKYDLQHTGTITLPYNLKDTGATKNAIDQLKYLGWHSQPTTDERGVMLRRLIEAPKINHDGFVTIDGRVVFLGDKDTTDKVTKPQSTDPKTPPSKPVGDPIQEYFDFTAKNEEIMEPEDVDLKKPNAGAAALHCFSSVGFTEINEAPDSPLAKAALKFVERLPEAHIPVMYRALGFTDNESRREFLRGLEGPQKRTFSSWSTESPHGGIGEEICSQFGDKRVFLKLLNPVGARDVSFMYHSSKPDVVPKGVELLLLKGALMHVEKVEGKHGDVLVTVTLRGGPRKGRPKTNSNPGHAGRPGLVGGSAPSPESTDARTVHLAARWAPPLELGQDPQVYAKYRGGALFQAIRPGTVS